MRVKTEAKRHAIVEVAREVFREKGYDAASMAEISARLGGSKGTLYSYFTSKEELFAAVMLDMAKKVGGPLFAELERATDVKQGLRTFAHQLVRLIVSPDFLDFRRMITAEGARSELGKLVWERGPAVYWRRFADFFKARAEQGVFRDADPYWAATHMEALSMAGPIQQLLQGAIDRVTDEDIAAVADAAVDVFLRAYALDKVSGRRRTAAGAGTAAANRA